MKTFLKLILMLIVAIPVVVLALANRGNVTLTANPFASGSNAGGVTLPLFLVILAAIALGVLVGGISTWFGQGKHRRAARLAKEQLGQLRGQGAAPSQISSHVVS